MISLLLRDMIMSQQRATFGLLFSLVMSPCLEPGMRAEEIVVKKNDIELLIKQLDDQDFTIRHRAMNQLIALGERALPAVLRVSQNGSVETRYRAQVILLEWKKQETYQFMPIPAGTFLMGSPERESGRGRDEDQHQVKIPQAFLLMKHEVTQQQFARLMKFNPSHHRSNQEQQASEKLPVENVTWFDALEYCNRLSDELKIPRYYQLSNLKKDGSTIIGADVKVLGGAGCRLPSEAEWEYACRAQTITPFHYGNFSRGEHANVRSKASVGSYGITYGRDAKNRTVEKGSYPANDWDLHDMHGNVMEWVEDTYDERYHMKPENSVKKSQHKVLKGGAWILAEENSRSASRYHQTPDERKNYIGFRVARSLQPPEKKK